ncbi:hypothetical protein EDB81DRAFT_254151 [Dactylonectria macrodidyma]|uniref:NDT80 domain-containing protein n=1 Tax=Dactylonectria macrodidyma TaxID=307937 RepID=A0A9P9JMD0_9HYPO|nr:hypothetical protein EDB81DRAFT_254151 [Dactylonectria macrodidyma]
MAHPHPHRTTGLPHPGPQISTREQYTPATPSFRRASEHPSRSPSFAGATLRRNPMSPTPSPITSFPVTGSNMGAGQFTNRGAQTIPPLLAVNTMGSLQYQDGALTPVKVDISGIIDKGFFLSDNEWTCYRRNYFSCGCSFSLTPYMPDTIILFSATGSNQQVQIYGFAMCISAVVSDNEQHSIDLVQHTPKRDKGPVMKPEKVRLGVKPPQQSHGHHHHMDMFPNSVVSGRYPESFATGGSHPTEHTFERIQFKQATQNNGKRRAAQQYYQLVVELWGDVGAQTGGEQFVKIAVRKSAKMIVRGRSPGHYQNDRRGSQSSGPGGSSGTLSNYVPGGTMGDFSQNPMLGPSAYQQGFDGRGNLYNVRHHDIPQESIIPAENVKTIETAKEYQYYPGNIYDGQSDRVDLFNSRTEAEAAVPHLATGLDVNGKIKHEYENATLPSIFHPPAQVSERRPGPFDGKPNTNGYYPTMIPQPGVNITMT